MYLVTSRIVMHEALVYGHGVAGERRKLAAEELIVHTGPFTLLNRGNYKT